MFTLITTLVNSNFNNGVVIQPIGFLNHFSHYFLIEVDIELFREFWGTQYKTKIPNEVIIKYSPTKVHSFCIELFKVK
jgi:hypothetical protein